MDSPDDLKPVCKGEQISAVPCAGGVIWTRRRDCRRARRCCAAADDNTARSRPFTKESVDGYVANANESRANPAREKPTLMVFRTFGEKMCVSRMLATCERSVM